MPEQLATLIPMVDAGATWFMAGAVNLRTAFALTRAAGVILQVVQRVHLARDVDETGSRTLADAGAVVLGRITR